ncbi:MAG: hypothetical protein JWO67_3194 [Streptosporangiaceae bacterium]|nr:hypothetical protein [Streptosporangiaceae bacterium]
MLQRNATNYTLVLPTFEPPVEVPPGWEIDHPVLLAGFESVDPAPAPVDPPPADPSTPAIQAPKR